MDPARSSPIRSAKTAINTQHDLFESIGVLASYSGLSLLFLFLFHFLMARYLGPEQYSVIATFMSILLTAILISSSFYLIITRFIAYHHSRSQYEEINYLVTNALKYFFAAGFLVFLLFLIFSQQIANFFNLSDIKPVVALGFAIWLQLLVPIYEAAFKGLDDVHSMGRMRVIESVSRWLIAMLLAYLSFGLTAMVIVLGLGTFVALSTTYVGIRSLQSRQLVKPNMQEIWAFAIPVFLVNGAIALLLNLDIILVKHYFPPGAAGVYAAASFVAKIPFLVSWVLGTVLFPRITRLHVDGLPSGHLLRQGLKWLTAFVIICTFVNIFFANAIFRHLFGPEYTFGSYLGVYSLAMGLLAIVNFIAVYQLGLKRFTLAKIVPWFLVLELGLLLKFHDSLFSVVTVSILVATLLVATAIYVLRNEIHLEHLLEE